MGSAVIVACPCGMERMFMIGGGMSNFQVLCLFPCLCERCQEIVPINLLRQRKRCPKCKSNRVIPYDDYRLSTGSGSQIVAQWNIVDQLGRELKLTDNSYYCPRCKQNTLHFTSAGLHWD
jgi:Zn finger protein HypA/HybF involved in hydrogenase expression